MLEKLPTAITFSLLNLAQDADVGRLAEEEALAQAQASLNQLRSSRSVVGTSVRVDDMAGQALDNVESFGSIWESVLNKLDTFAEIAKVISEV